MRDRAKIYVALLDESVEVWRPIVAELLYDHVYKIAEQPYDRDSERWEFEPGDEVICSDVEADDGLIVAAVRRA